MQSTREETGQSLFHPIFDDLISAFLSIQDLKPPILRSLHALLGDITLRTEIGGGSYPGIVPTREKILTISVILFNSLEERFRNFFLAISDVSSSCSTGDTKFCLEEQYPDIDELTVLLRCCLALLTWLGFDQTLLIEKARILLSILSRLISFDVNGKNGDHSIKLMLRQERTCAEDGFTTSVVEDFLEAPCPYRSSLCALLEVFADELLAEGSSSQFLVCAESAVAPSERLFLCFVDDYHIEIVLEVMSAHLLLLFSDKQASENALDRLKRWHCQEEFRVPELQLRAALSLLLNPITHSAPKLFQGHLILLVSDAIRTGVLPHLVGLNLMDCYLVLEKSVLLYKQHMSAYVEDHPLHAGDSFSGSSTNVNMPLFSSCIKLVTRGKLDHVIANSETLWDSCMQNMTLKNNTELLSASITFLKEDPFCLDKSCKDDGLSVLIGLTTAAFSDDPTSIGALDNRKGRSSHDIYLLSSILKLMSVSMFQFVRSFNGKADILRCCKVYSNHLVVMLRCFEQFAVRLPVQSFLEGVMKDHPMRNKESSWMLLHFSGLLSLCFASRLDFLVKDCLSVMMALMNLIALEGDLASLRSLLGLESYSAACEREEKVLRRRQKVAITFLRFQMRFMSQAASPGGDSRRRIKEGNACTALNREEDISSGEVFVKCFLQAGKGQGGEEEEEDDLMDFVEIKERKDYFSWSKNRDKYRTKKLDKKVDMRRKRQRKAWTMMINQSR